MARARTSAGTTKSGAAGEPAARARAPRRPSSTASPATPPPPAPSDAGASVTIDLGMIRGVARSASRIVSQAATILEEELSAGIGAARQIEERFLNVAETRSTNPDEVIARFRKDAHEVVDIALDVLSASTRSISGLAQRISVGEAGGAPSSARAPYAPTLALPGEVARGGSGSVPFLLENDGDAETARFTFQATDLVNADGETISARHVTFQPPALTVPPHDRENVTISVAVPTDAAPGVYSGLVLATNLERLRAVLLLTVE